MEHPPGSIEQNGELWLRCPFCGDSPHHLNRCHFSINLRTGLYHCYRCRTSGKLLTSQLIVLIMQMGVDQVFSEFDLEDETIYEEELPQLTVGPAVSRFSALKRYHYRDPAKSNLLYDAFEIRDPLDEQITGVYLRRSDKKESKICGGGGFGWVGKGFPTSSPNHPLRVVEGPYDVLTDRDICTFGMVTQGVRDLHGHSVVLTPDGDVWIQPELFQSFLKQVYNLIHSRRLGPYLVGLEIIPDGKDPDEVPVSKREFLPRGALIKSRLAKKKQSRNDFIEGLLQ